VHQRVIEPDRLLDDIGGQAGTAGTDDLVQQPTRLGIESIEPSVRRELHENELVGRPVDAEMLLGEHVFGSALLDRPRFSMEEPVDLGNQREALGIGLHEGLDHVAVGDTRDAVREDQGDLEQLVEMQQRRHPAEGACPPPVGMGHRSSGHHQVLHLGNIVVELHPLAMDIDDPGFDRDHAVHGLVGRIAHLGVGQNREIVELDAVVLAVLHELVDAAHE
jgi:hypothetical protein